MDDLRFIEPYEKYKDSYAVALKEGLHTGPVTEEVIYQVLHHFDTYIAKRHDLARPVTLPSGEKIDRVPQIDRWLVDKKNFIGVAGIRLTLNPHLEKYGGNIGYAVAVSYRGQGYGTRILKEALDFVAAQGLKKVLVTCADDNIASQKIIEKNGGVFQDCVDVEGLSVPTRRYWFTL